MENKNGPDFKRLSVQEAELLDAKNDLEVTSRTLAYYQNYTLELLALVGGLKAQLEEMRTSTRWKITAPLWFVREKLFRGANDQQEITPEIQAGTKKVCLHRDFEGEKNSNILFIDRKVPQPDRDAGSRTSFQYMQLLVEMGYTVKLLADDVQYDEKYKRALIDLGIDLISGEDDGWKDFIVNNAPKIGFAVPNRPNVALKYIDFIEEHTDAKIVYFGHDLHYLRETRNYEQTGDPAALESAARIKVKEFIAMSKSDVVLMYGEYEKKIILKEFGIDHVVAAPIYYFDQFDLPRKEWEESKDILFVGGFLHKPNVDAVLWFYREVWECVKVQLGNARFIIAGSNPPEEIQALADERVIVTGFIPDEELDALYAGCRVCVIPLRFGAGIKGKTIEAMRWGIPIVSTSVGIEGLDAADGFIIPADTAEEFASQVTAKYADRTTALKEGVLSTAYVKGHFSRASLKRVLCSVFASK